MEGSGSEVGESGYNFGYVTVQRFAFIREC